MSDCNNWNELKLLYQFLSGAHYASSGAAFEVLGSACERLDVIIKKFNGVPETDKLFRGFSSPIDTNPSRE